MKMRDYGVWVSGMDYKNIDAEGYDTKWYREGDLSIIPEPELEIPFFGLDYHVNGVDKAHFKVAIDDDYSEPFELEIWDDEQAKYRPCCLVTRDNIWSKMASAKL